MLRIALALILLVPAYPIAAANPCTPGVVTTYNSPDGTTYYYWDRPEATYVYQETNGVIGLQPGGAALIGNDYDACNTPDPWGPDQLLFVAHRFYL